MISYSWDFMGLARTKESVDVARTLLSEETCFFFFKVKVEINNSDSDFRFLSRNDGR